MLLRKVKDTSVRLVQPAVKGDRLRSIRVGIDGSKLAKKNCPNCWIR